MRFSTKCWSEHILSAYKATKDLKHPLYMTFKVEQDGFSLRVMYLNHAEGIANSVDPDQTAPLIWVCTVCSRLSV